MQAGDFLLLDHIVELQLKALQHFPCKLKRKPHKVECQRHARRAIGEVSVGTRRVGWLRFVTSPWLLLLGQVENCPHKRSLKWE